jgi:hypothetical protein
MGTQKIMMNLRLKMAIHASGRRQRAVAQAARIPETRLSEIVNQRGTPVTDPEKKSLARALERPIRELFSAADEALAS